MSAHRVFVAGPASWNQIVHLDEFPEPRSHMTVARSSYETVGGTSAGKALNLADLGVEVALHTVLGPDVPGDLVVDILRHHRVHVFADHSGGRTERHLNLMDRQGGRISIYLDRPDTPTPFSPPTSVLAALDAAAVAVVDLADHARPFLSLARDRGRRVWVDLHDFDGVSEWYREFWVGADAVFCNDDGMDDPMPFLRECIGAGARLAVVTRGADGATAVTPEGRFDTPAVPVGAIADTNGAGDGFFAGFLTAHLDGAAVPDALAAGATQASRCLTSTGLAPGVI